MEKKPHIRIVIELSLDGKMTLAKGESSRKLFSYQHPDLKLFTHQQRALFDGILIGAETVRVDNPFLTVRGVKCKSAPARIIVSNSCEFSRNLNIFDKSAPTILVTSQTSFLSNNKKIAQPHTKILACGNKEVDFLKMLSVLYENGIHKLIVEGGPRILERFLYLDVVDEICIKYIPILIAGNNTPSFLPLNAEIGSIKFRKWKLNECKVIGEHVVSMYGRMAC